MVKEQLFGFVSKVSIKNDSHYALIPSIVAEVYGLRPGDILEINVKVVKRNER